MHTFLMFTALLALVGLAVVYMVADHKQCKAARAQIMGDQA